MKGENLTPEELKRATKAFTEFVQRRSIWKMTISHNNNEAVAEALKWFMSYDEVEKGQIIRLAYEMWQENQQVVLQQVSGER
jgi:hypothetical protein